MTKETPQNNHPNNPENNPVFDQTFLDSLKDYAQQVTYPAAAAIFFFRKTNNTQTAQIPA